MQCKWIRVEGNTTKYFRCSLKDKAIDEYKCKDCPMFLKNDNADDVVNRLFDTFGGRR